MAPPKKIDSKSKKWGYKKWHAMMRRASGRIGKHWYSNSSVSDDFKNFEDFEQWATKQFGYGMDGYQLDKDILKKGNTQYSPDACSFVPGRINSLFIRGKARRGALPIGVFMQKGRYVAEFSVDSKRFRVGTYGSPVEAFNAYKAAKESEIKRIAVLWQEKIDPRVYQAMMTYQVEITD